MKIEIAIVRVLIVIKPNEWQNLYFMILFKIEVFLSQK